MLVLTEAVDGKAGGVVVDCRASDSIVEKSRGWYMISRVSEISTDLYPRW